MAVEFAFNTYCCCIVQPYGGMVSCDTESVASSVPMFREVNPQRVSRKRDGACRRYGFRKRD